MRQQHAAKAPGTNAEEHGDHWDPDDTPQDVAAHAGTVPYTEQLHLRVPPFVLPMELPPTATITEAPLLLPCPAAGRAGDCPIHMPAVAMKQVVQGQVCPQPGVATELRYICHDFCKGAVGRGGAAHAIAIVIGCSEETAPAMDEHRLVSAQGGCVKLETSRDGLTDAARRRGARASCARGGPSTQGHCAAIRTLRIVAIATLPHLAVVSCAHTLPNPGGG